MNDSILRTEVLSIGYRNTEPLLNNLNLELFQGKLTSLFGENGVGKSTLIRTFMGILKPINGNIFLNNRNLVEYSSSELSKIMSVVLTDKLSSDNLTVFDIISFGRMPYTNFFGKLSDADFKMVSDVLDLLKITNLKDCRFSELSDGQKQKVLIAKALAQESKIMLLDEPTAFLDISAKEEIFALLKQFADERNIAVLVSTHDIHSALKVSDYLWLMNSDKIICGKTDELVISNQLQSVFPQNDFEYDPEKRVLSLKIRKM